MTKTPVDLLKDKPSKAILSLSIPIILLNILKGGFNIVDMFWLGRLGKDFLAGVSASVFMVWAVNGLTSLVTVGIVAGVSRNIGEGRIETAKSNCMRALELTFLLGAACSIVLFPLINPLVDMIKLESTARTAGIEYLQIMIGTSFVAFMMFSLHSILIAWGDTKTPVIVEIITFIFNIVLSPLLMFGYGQIPRLETVGAAVATIICYLIASLLYLYIIVRNKWIRLARTGDEIKFTRYITLGCPVALSSMFFSFIYFFIAKVTAIFGSGAIGAMGIGHKIESFTYFIAHGFASGLSTFVGRNIGAKLEERTFEASIFSFKAVCLVTALFSLVSIIFAKEFVGIFNTDPDLLHHGVRYLWFVMPAEIIQCGGIVFENGTFAGSGYTKPSFYVAMPIIFARIPLSWFLAIKMGLGANGIWLTIALTMLLTNGIFCVLYRQKKWIKTKI
jgi:putative MATE family efflux protein